MARPAGGDPLERGRLTLRQHGIAVELVTAHGVFSAAAVDPGTAFLLRWLAASAAGRRRVLDLGCGYGPLALWLAAADPSRTVLAVDRDAVAVQCTELGAAGNGLDDRVTVRASLGYDDVAPVERFDLIVSNIPAKVGRAALRHFLLDAWFRLEDGGAASVVVVDRLAGAVEELLAGEPAVAVDEHHRNRGYAAWTYRFVDVPAADSGPAFDRGVYGRTTAAFAAGRTRWEATTSFTVPEFDTLAHATVAAAELLEQAPLADGPVALVGVGQGHLAQAVRATSGSALPLRLVDRDLLALRTAAANVGDAGVDLRHVAHPALDGCAAAVVALPEKQPVSVTAALLAPALGELAPGSPVVVHGRAADVTRVLDLLAGRGGRLVVRHRRAHRGGSAALTVTPPP